MDIISELRWILLLAGVVLLGVVYYFSRRTAVVEDEELAHRDQAPYLEPESMQQEGRLTPELEEQQGSAEADPHSHEDSAGADGVDDGENVSPEATDPSVESSAAPVITEKVVVLHLLPAADALFDGAALIDAFEAEGLKFGHFDIYHRYTDVDGGEPESLYSVANVVKPGTFQLQNLATQQLKGASMFLVLPGPEDAVAAFADMLATGRRLAATLEGQLVDGQGATVSRQLASHIREDIINYQHGISSTSMTV